MAKKIMAAGGIVINEEGKILFEFRRGKWDLPKGKVDDGETLEECAVREIEEETGVTNIELGSLAGITYHYYTENEMEVEKETHWFNMKVHGPQKLIPQTEEDIMELRWVSVKELPDYLSDTYANIKEILSKKSWLL